MPLSKLLIFVLTVAILAGCAAGPVKLNPQEQETVHERFEQNQKKLKYWQMNGRFSFRVDNKIHTGNIRWVNNDNRYGIKFSGPLDQAPVFVTYDGKEVTLKDSQGYEGTASTAEAMLARYTEYELPVSNLKYWLIGLPSPYSHPSVKLNAQGYPIEISQDAWTVEYQYFRDVDSYLLPRKIIITHPTLKLTLSIYEL
jgi:outer membrane lipoprotein LolB